MKALTWIIKRGGGAGLHLILLVCNCLLVWTFQNLRKTQMLVLLWKSPVCLHEKKHVGGLDHDAVGFQNIWRRFENGLRQTVFWCLTEKGTEAIFRPFHTLSERVREMVWGLIAKQITFQEETAQCGLSMTEENKPLLPGLIITRFVAVALVSAVLRYCEQHSWKKKQKNKIQLRICRKPLTSFTPHCCRYWLCDM